MGNQILGSMHGPNLYTVKGSARHFRDYQPFPGRILRGNHPIPSGIVYDTPYSKRGAGNTWDDSHPASQELSETLWCIGPATGALPGATTPLPFSTNNLLFLLPELSEKGKYVTEALENGTLSSLRDQVRHPGWRGLGP